MVVVGLVFKETVKLFSREAIPFCFYQQCMSDSVPPFSHEHLVFIIIYLSYFISCVVMFH